MRATSISRAFCASIAFMGTVTASVAQAQSPPVLIRAEKVYTVTKRVLEPGEILLCGGTICEVGSQVTAPPDAVVHEASVVIPGMIDAHSHIALDRSGGPRISGPVAASVSFQGVTSPTVRSQMPTRRSKTAIQNQHNGLSDTPPL
jgi:imidazolonepropionase-like amidohydrolase